jgi:hypothetical protein
MSMNMTLQRLRYAYLAAQQSSNRVNEIPLADYCRLSTLILISVPLMEGGGSH